MQSDNISQIFNDLINAGWDEQSPILFSYYFFGTKRGRLFEAGEEMSKYDFTIQPIEEDKETSFVFWLRADKKEALTAATMEDKVEQLEELAEDYEIFFDRFEAEL